MKSPKLHIDRIFFIYLALVGFACLFSVGFLWTHAEISRFKKDAAALRTSLLEDRKRMIKLEVDRALDVVRHMQSKTELRLRGSVKSKVYEAHAIAENIFQKEKSKKSITDIKDTIREALRPIRYNKGRGYFFAFSLDGVERLFPVNPDMEGRSMLQVKGGEGESVVPDMIELAKTQGEGFYRYTWSKPGMEGYFPKVAFIKLVEPLGWIIGTGEYLDDIRADIQEECLEWISNIKFGRDGYVFAGQWDGKSISGPETGRNMIAVEDANGVKIVQKLIEAAKSGGGYVQYVLPQFEGKKHAPKISYAVGVPEWQWYIGAGVYLDDIENQIALKQAELDKRIGTSIQYVFLILFSLLVSISLIVKFLSNRIAQNMRLFSGFFSHAASGAAKIELSALHFKEFVRLAESANEMLDSRRRVEQALRESEEKYRLLVEIANDAIFIIQDEYVKFQNPRTLELIGYNAQELATLPFRQLIHPKDRDLVQDRYERGLKGEKPSRAYSFRMVHKSGRHLNVQINATSMIWEQKPATLNFLRDVTSQQIIEEQLRHAQKIEAIGTLAGGIAHDFNNILSAILGYSELALADLPPGNPIRYKLESIYKSGERARDLVTQILAFSRKDEPVMMPVTMHLIVQDALKILRPAIPSTIEIKTQVNSGCDVLGDPSQLHRIIMNLCTNAYQAMVETGGILSISLSTVTMDAKSSLDPIVPGSYALLVVADTGTGIAPENLDRIFDPYFTTKERGKGTGLGLATVHGIVKSHGGAIRVDSQEGRGTRFEIYLPLTQEKISPGGETPSPLAGGHEHILLVDDEPDILDIERQMLEHLGYAITTQGSAKEALTLFAAQPEKFDLVLTDMTMPTLSGDKLAAELKNIRSDIPIVLCTGFNELVSKEKADSLGINGFLMKPVKMADLAAMVRKLLG